MIRSPHTQDAGENPQLEGARRKMRKYESIQAELLSAGITYTPLVWSCYGAPHASVTQALGTAAHKALALPRAGDVPSTLRRWEARIAVEIWRRNARLAQRCLRSLTDPEHTEEISREGKGVEDCDPQYGDEWEEAPLTKFQ